MRLGAINNGDQECSQCHALPGERHVINDTGTNDDLGTLDGLRRMEAEEMIALHMAKDRQRTREHNLLVRENRELTRLLDSGKIRLIQRDEFGRVGFHLYTGIDLRKCIAEAIEATDKQQSRNSAAESGDDSTA